MNAISRLQQMPDWPARMTAPIAALYMGGMGESTFLERYRSIAKKEGGNTYWAKEQLDRLVREQFDLAAPEQSGAGVDDPYEQWKAGRQGR
jgi:hypothetical protein